MATSMGWYMYAVVAAEVPLCIAGLRAILPSVGNIIPSIGVLLFALLDLYALHAVALPYYVGLIIHRGNGSLTSLHFSDVSRLGISEVFARLMPYKADLISTPVLAASWIAYVSATIILVVITFRGVRTIYASMK
jgi:hypothetical protein